MSGAGAPGQSLYIYWKVAPARQAEALAAVRRFQAGAVSGSEQASLLRRADAAEAGAPVTLMEIYTAPGGLPPPRADALVAASSSALSAWALGGRHVERFEPA